MIIGDFVIWFFLAFLKNRLALPVVFRLFISTKLGFYFCT